ncbi:MAG: enoyl-CoA hydratase-related protein [Planctomycetota bacterium]
METVYKIGNVTADYPSGACARVRIGIGDAKQTFFDNNTLASFEKVLTKIESHISLRGVIFTGAAPGKFPTGTDPAQFVNYTNAVEAEAAALRVQACFHRIARMPWNTVAAIDGPCLGAALELALACKIRIAADSPRVRFGFPEVLFGIIPGGGGTQRLPRTIGYIKSLEWIVTGRRYTPADALGAGVIDLIVSAAELDAAALRGAEGQLNIPPRRKEALIDKLINRTSAGRAYFASQAKKKVRGTANGEFPAAIRAIEVARDGYSRKIEDALLLEARAFGELLVSDQSRELVRFYLTSKDTKKNQD